MTVKVVVRKGNSAINSAYTGEVAELTYDSDNKTIRVHDGSTAGGTRAVTTNASGTIVSTNTISVANLSSNTLLSNSANIVSLVVNTANIATATINTSSVSNLNVTAANIGNLNANSIGATLVTANTINATVATISGGTINQTQIGLTTPNTAAFTSVTVVDEPTSNTQLANKLYVDRKVRLAIALSGV